jgi:hypothetical protein
MYVKIRRTGVLLPRSAPPDRRLHFQQIVAPALPA